MSTVKFQDIYSQGQKTKGALKGVWSSLAGPPVTPQLPTPKTRTVNPSDTFAAFQRAAKEKADR